MVVRFDTLLRNTNPENIDQIIFNYDEDIMDIEVLKAFEDSNVIDKKDIWQSPIPEKDYEMIDYKERFVMSIPLSKPLHYDEEKRVGYNVILTLPIKTLEKLPGCKTPGVKRNVLKIFTRRDLPESDEIRGKTIELCFNWLNSKSEPIAVRVLCMMLLERIALKNQWLIPQLIYTIENVLEKEHAIAICSQGKKTVKKLRKLML